MKALRGLSVTDTLRLAEIETYIKTKKRPNDLQITDEWIDESLKFLVEQLRPTIDAWIEMGNKVDRSVPIVIAAGKLHRARKRGVRGSKMKPFYRELEEALHTGKPLEEETNT